MKTTKPKFITISQVAEILGCSTRTVFRMKKRRQIPSYKISNKLLFDEADILKYVEKSKIEISVEVEAEAEAA